MVGAATVVATGALADPQWLIARPTAPLLGELCLSPVGLSSVTKLAPPRLVGQMMGLWFLATSLGLLLAGLVAGEFDAQDVASMPGQYLRIALVSLISGAALLLIASRVQRRSTAPMSTAGAPGSRIAPSRSAMKIATGRRPGRSTARMRSKCAKSATAAKAPRCDIPAFGFDRMQKPATFPW